MAGRIDRWAWSVWEMSVRSPRNGRRGRFSTASRNEETAVSGNVVARSELQDEHGIAVAVEPVSVSDSLLIRLQHQFAAGKGADEDEER